MVRSYHSKSRKNSRNVKRRKSKSTLRRKKSKSKSRKSKSTSKSRKSKKKRKKKTRRHKGGHYELQPAFIDTSYTLGSGGQVAHDINFNGANDLVLQSGVPLTQVNEPVPNNHNSNTNNVIHEPPYSLKGEGGTQVRTDVPADADADANADPNADVPVDVPTE